MTELNLEIAASENKAATVTYNKAMFSLASIIAFGMGAGILLAIFISRAIANQVDASVAGLKDIAQGEGDLTMRLEIASKDEVGELARWFNTFIEKLQGIIKEMATSSNQVSLSAQELSNLSENLKRMADQFKF